MVVIEMENGKKIKLELYPEIAPISCENFEKLVKQGFYDGLTFHRIISGVRAAIIRIRSTRMPRPFSLAK